MDNTIKQTRQCAVCGAEFTPRSDNQKYCSKLCSRKHYWRQRFGDMERAVAGSHLVSNEHIMRAVRKPPNTSAVRWRMELRRRANPELYAMAVEA